MRGIGNGPGCHSVGDRPSTAAPLLLSVRLFFLLPFLLFFLLISLFPTPLTLQEDPLVPFPSKGPVAFLLIFLLQIP